MTLLRNVWLWGLCCLAFTSPGRADEAIDFNRDIRPLLSDRCFSCHGPEEKSREAGLRLDDKQIAFGELDSGATAIVVGDVAKSELITRITESDADLRMPPADSGKTLSSAEVDLLKRWIKAGAPWADHWSFVAPIKHAPPAVKNSAWVKNEIDRFVLARLEAAGMSPSLEADKRTLIRRVTFDLTGLPPTLAEIEAFASDESPEAYEKLVDRLLASERYGEHMARFWLDASRYGDTHGLHLDNYREMWPYRDWVVRSFNSNQPYDQFTIEQLAGDLLPNPTTDQLIATGFNRCHVTTGEGGSIEEEVYVRNTIDRVSTTSTVFMGLTMECSRCHDHKFDPLTQKDFYAMFAYFNSLEGSPLDGNVAKYAPVITVTTPEIENHLQGLETQIAAAQAKLLEPIAEVDAAQLAWEQLLREQNAGQAEWTMFDPQAFKSSGGATLTKLDDQSVLASGSNSATDVYELVGKLPAGAVTALRLEGLVHDSLTNKGHGRSVNSNVVMTGFEAEIASAEKPEEFRPIKFVRAWADHEQTNGDFKIANAIDANPQSGWATAGYEKLENRTAIFIADAPQGAAGDVIRIRLRFESVHSQHQFGRVRLATTSAKVIPQVDVVGVPPEMVEIAKLDAAARTAEQQTKLRDFYRKSVSKNPAATKLYSDIDALVKQRDAINNAKPTTLIWKEMAQPRDSFILHRGEYDQRRDKVTRATPAALPPLPEGAAQTRLGFAQWLVSPQHPLTARVAVNRFWQQLFGTGIVKTAEDFGAQGEPPSHPLLLDYLAVDFRENGWSVKRLMKQMVMSAAYRQSSKVTPEMLERDPRNRLLSRGPRFRLDGEMLRDQALAVSGLLVEKLGGPGVKPPQPNLWILVGYSGSNTVNFSADSGPEKVHRRTLYTFFKRTSPPPQMSTFDAPSRESCTVRRERTNTPLQMLLLMNDPQYVEAARALAERTMKGGDSTEKRVDFMFQLCTARLPRETERAELVRYYEATLADFQAAQDAAGKLLTVGEAPVDAAMPTPELAAWTLVANLVLCLDEVVTKN
jgi:hypothetical protein